VQFIAPSLLEEGGKDYTSMVTFSQPGGRAEQEAREAAQRLSGNTENAGDAPVVNPPAGDSQTGDSPADTSKPATSSPAGDPAPKSSASSQSKPSAEKPAPDSTVQSDNAVKVSLQTVGTYQTTVVMNGEKQAVMTANLTFGEDVPADKALAVAYAPRTGKISLRDSASDSARVAGQLKAGQVVAVMRYGQSYCYVSSGSKSGYAKTASLRFHAPIAEETGAASAQLSYKGKTNGSTTINIRLDADKDSRKIGEFRTGTPVIVLGSANGWTQIEVNGLRGYVMDAFVKLD
jgi:SH3-like domain-containing protein